MEEISLKEKKRMLTEHRVWCEDVRDFWVRESVDLDVTVVVPTNTDVFLAEQAYAQAKEVLLLCNGGINISSPNARIINVSWDGHAKTRKLALGYLRTKYVFFSVQDAFPIGNMLCSLVEEMERGKWDILMPRQVPWPDCDDIDRARILN